MKEVLVGEEGRALKIIRLLFNVFVNDRDERKFS